MKKINLEDVENNNKKVRKKASPKMRAIMDEVQTAFDEENRLMDARQEAEDKLRAWGRAMCGTALDISEIEELNAQIANLKNGDVLRFNPKRSSQMVVIYKTAFGTVDRLDKYIFALEKTIVDLTNKLSICDQPKKDPFTEKTFLDLIKLAFNRLLKRSN